MLLLLVGFCNNSSQLENNINKMWRKYHWSAFRTIHLSRMEIIILQEEVHEILFISAAGRFDGCCFNPSWHIIWIHWRGKPNHEASHWKKLGHILHNQNLSSACAYRLVLAPPFNWVETDSFSFYLCTLFFSPLLSYPLDSSLYETFSYLDIYSLMR